MIMVVMGMMVLVVGMVLVVVSEIRRNFGDGGNG